VALLLISKFQFYYFSLFLNSLLEMKKIVIKQITWYAIVVLLLAVAIIPLVKAAMPSIFPEGFRDVDCQGVSCPEGHFCQSNQCHPNATRYPNSVPSGNL
jgi:hypothetical protein